MIINFDKVFKDFEDQNVKKQTNKLVDDPNWKDPKDGSKAPQVKELVDLTLKLVCTEALMSMPKDPDALSGDDKVERYELAKLIYGGGDIELATEKIVLLKALVGKNYVPLIVGPAFRMLEGK